MIDRAGVRPAGEQSPPADLQGHRRHLALNVGPRGRKLPDWQLDPVKHRLTQAILQGAPGVDTWTLYRALSDPLEGLNGLSPVDAVTEDSIDAIAKVVFNVLGVH
jgi:hypothetical protein